MPSLAPRIDTLESTPTFSGQASFAAGSAAAPSLRFTVDPTTGLYRIGAGSIGFSSAGVAVGSIGVSWTMGAVAGGGNHVIYGRDGSPASFTSSVYIQSSNAANSVRLGFGIYETGDYAWIQSLETDTANPKGLKLFAGSIEAFSYNASAACTLGSASTVGVGGYTHTIQAAPTSSTVLFLRNMTAASTIAQIQVFYNNTTSAGFWRADNVNSFFVTNSAGTLQNFAVADTGACTLGNTSATGASGGHHVVRSGYSGVSTSMYSNGEIHFGNSDSGGTIPTIAGTTTTANNVGLYLSAAANNTNSAADMNFDVRESDVANGSDFATLTNKAFRWTRYGNELASMTRSGAVTLGLTLGHDQPTIPFKPLVIQTPVSASAIGFTKFHKISDNASAVDLVTITSAVWDNGHNLCIYVEAFNITTGLYSIVKGAATSTGSSASNAITLAATDVHNNGLGLGSFAWSAGTGAATLRYTPPTNTDKTVYEITINNRKFPYTLP